MLNFLIYFINEVYERLRVFKITAPDFELEL